MGDASCDVNGAFHDASRVALFRNGPGRPHGINIPLPPKLDASIDTMLGTPRQDVDLSTRHAESHRDRKDGCGAVAISVDVTEVSATRVSVSYRETPDPSCGRPACSVDYTLDLVEAACARDCKATSATLYVDASGSMTWRCDCE